MASEALRKAVKKIMRLNRHYMSEDMLARKANLAALISERAESGKVAIVYGGVDCDGSRWDNRVDIVQANLTTVNAWIDRYMESAEGPQWTQIAPPSEAAELESSSRDLVLEAFEDGHPGTLYL